MRMPAPDYHRLQQSLDKVLGKLGLEQTIRLLDNLIVEARSGKKKKQRNSLIEACLKDAAVEAFDLEEEQFFSSKEREYREARMACYHLLKKYLDYSYPRIAKKYDLSERMALYYCKKVEEELLDLPGCHPVFTARYREMEAQLLQFIATRN